ncbi:MAG TPA: hypothetical protein VGT61_01650 [Thermomicrobiales bacterium]|jgi:hypothetical protein|nr:hypothetical protein [Thermomicrobiales bacterium]
MSDRPINRNADVVRDNDGTVYDIEGDSAKLAPGDPRDENTGYPSSGFVAGGAGGTGNMGAASVTGTSAASPGSETDRRATSQSGTHGAVAESADLGQRPLADYKREGDAAADATDTTVGAGTGSADSASARPASSYTSDTDAVDTRGTRVTERVITSTSGTASGSGSDSGSISANTDNTTSAMSSDPVSARSTHTETRDIGSGGGGISATTDNTGPIGGGTQSTLTGVAEGYRVVDANGDDLGKVRDVRSGDMGAASTGGGDDGYDEGLDQSTRSTVGIAAVPTGIGSGTGNTGSGVGVPAVVATDSVDDGDGVYGDGEPNVDEPAFTRLSRTGFIKIDSKGWFASDCYAGADQVARVEGETVYLSAVKDELIPER